MTVDHLLPSLVSRDPLPPELAEEVMAWLISGAANEAQVGGVLLALRVRGISGPELAGFARALRARAITLRPVYNDLVDTCGTGGGISSFNLSTAAAFVAAGAGVRIAKHGNRGVTSKCGMGDVLEALGVALGGSLDALEARLETTGIAFLFAPAHHPAMANVGKARRDLGVRTVFNQLGPLANPAGARRQLIGVYDSSLMQGMAEALNELGSERVLLVHGEDGLDEISAVAPTEAYHLQGGKIEPMRLTPADFGLIPISAEALASGRDAAENADILREAISDIGSNRAMAVLPNAAAAIWLAGLEPTFMAAADRARSSIASGKAAQKLAEAIAWE